MFNSIQKITICCSFVIFLSISYIIIVEYAHAQSPINNTFDISGLYISDKQDIYHVKHINNTVWILGTTSLNNVPDTVANIFSGTLDDNFNRIRGKWINSPLLNNTYNGDVNFDLSIGNSEKNITIHKISPTTESKSVYPVNILTKYDPAVHGPLTIYVSMKNILIDIPRSPVSDILYVGISGQKNNDKPLVSTKYLGPRGFGSNTTTDLRIGPFSIDNENDSLKVYILGLDKDDGTKSFTLISLRNALIQLIESSYNVTNLVEATNIISSLSPALIPTGCNGLVFIDKLELTSESLRNLTTFNEENNQEKIYTGTSSPPGCGPPSQYVIKLSIKNHE
ncbi:MAG TPA: hypothetical protein VFV86_08665 [Nitrososphaeraceae archaeon]|nr:hypothetical protein [Nitrososphaeraceae archaeon]